MTQVTELISGVYWRKNPFLASSMMPLVMTLADGRLTAVGPDGAVVMDAPADRVTGRLGRMGTLKIKVDGRAFAIVGRGSLGGLEAGHTAGQNEYVHRFVQRHPHTEPARPAGAGVVDALFNQGAAAKLTVWRDALVALGARIR